MKISRLTRRGIVDAIVADKVNLYGRLQETAFLSRLFDLQRLPSFDPRFKDAAGDIWQHRVNNRDWSDSWIFFDARFNLLNGDDEVFLRFLAQVLHPAVRPDSTEAQRLCQRFNQYLAKDGFQLIECARLSGKPVFVGRPVGVSTTPGLN